MRTVKCCPGSSGRIRVVPRSCARPRCTLQASDGREQRASSSPSPPLEERAGERRPITLVDAVVRGDIPGGCRTDMPGGQAENDDLLSLPLFSRGGEGNGAGAPSTEMPIRSKQCRLSQEARCRSMRPADRVIRPAPLSSGPLVQGTQSLAVADGPHAAVAKGIIGPA